MQNKKQLKTKLCTAQFVRQYFQINIVFFTLFIQHYFTETRFFFINLADVPAALGGNNIGVLN